MSHRGGCRGLHAGVGALAGAGVNGEAPVWAGYANAAGWVRWARGAESAGAGHTGRGTRGGAEFGHRSVALIDGPPGVDTVHRRVSAARRLYAASGIALTVRPAAATEDGGWEAMTRILSRGARPTACGVGSLNQLFGV